MPLLAFLVVLFAIVGVFGVLTNNNSKTDSNYAYDSQPTTSPSNYISSSSSSSSSYDLPSSSSSSSNDFKGGFSGTGVSCPACDSLNTALTDESTRFDSEGRIEYWDTFKCKDCGNVFTEPFQDSGYSSYYNNQY